MKIITESENYSIEYEYEKVYLKIKKTSRIILIGEFYGDPDVAVISDDEKFCAVGGEGLIIYYIKEPFEEYRTDIEKSKQWTKYGRSTNKETIWINEITQIDSEHIRIGLESAETILISVY